MRANEFTSTFFHPASLPISLPPLELDNNYATIYSCLEEEFASSEEKPKEGYRVLYNGLRSSRVSRKLYRIELFKSSPSIL